MSQHETLALLARLHSSDLVRVAFKATSEEQTLCDVFEALKIDHYRHNSIGHASPEKEKIDPAKIQKWLIDNGCNVSIYACTGVVQGPFVYVFYCSSPEFTREAIPRGALLFTLNRETGEFKKHRQITCTE